MTAGSDTPAPGRASRMPETTFLTGATSITSALTGRSLAVRGASFPEKTMSKIFPDGENEYVAAGHEDAR